MGKRFLTCMSGLITPKWRLPRRTEKRMWGKGRLELRATALEALLRSAVHRVEKGEMPDERWMKDAENVLAGDVLEVMERKLKEKEMCGADRLVSGDEGQGETE